MSSFADSVKKYSGVMYARSATGPKVQQTPIIAKLDVAFHDNTYNDMTIRDASGMSYDSMAMMRAYECQHKAPDFRPVYYGEVFNTEDILDTMATHLELADLPDGEHTVSIDRYDLYSAEPLGKRVYNFQQQDVFSFGSADKADVSFIKSGDEFVIKYVNLDVDKYVDVDGHKVFLAAELANKRFDENLINCRYLPRLKEIDSEGNIKASVDFTSNYVNTGFPVESYYDPDDQYEVYVNNVTFVDGEFNVKLKPTYNGDLKDISIHEWSRGIGEADGMDYVIQYLSPFMQEYMKLGGEIDLISCNELTRRVAVDAATQLQLENPDTNIDSKYLGISASNAMSFEDIAADKAAKINSDGISDIIETEVKAAEESSYIRRIPDTSGINSINSVELDDEIPF